MDLPPRPGPRPRTHQAMPHSQLDQTAPRALQEELHGRACGLAGVTTGRSGISVPGARAYHLDAALARGPPESRMRGTEFAHLHPPEDGSLHLLLPEDAARAVVERAWGEWHPLVTQGAYPGWLVMVYGPRDEGELEVVWRIVRASHAFARGDGSTAPG